MAFDSCRHVCHALSAWTAQQLLGTTGMHEALFACTAVLAALTGSPSWQGAPTSARAIPVAIFSTEPAIARSFLRKWTGELSDCARPLGIQSPGEHGWCFARVAPAVGSCQGHAQQAIAAVSGPARLVSM